MYVTSIAVSSNGISGTNLFAGNAGDGVFLSTNNGANWTEVGLENEWVASLVISPNGAGGTNLFAGTNSGSGIYLSTNNGTSWTAVNSSLPTNISVTSLAVSDTNLFAGTLGSGVFLSNDNGVSWTAVNLGLTGTQLTSLAVSGTNLFAGTYMCGVFVSTNNGTSWIPSDPMYYFVESLAASGANLFAGMWGGGVFLSTNNGTSWTPANFGLPRYVTSLGVSGTNLFAGDAGANANSAGVFLSTNNGTSWAEFSSGLPAGVQVMSLVFSGTNLIAGTSDGVFRSTNETSWTAVNSGLTNTPIYSLAVNGSSLFAGTNIGVFLSTDNGTSWREVNTISGLALAVFGTNLFVGGFNGIFLSTNNGTSWTNISSGLSTNFEVTSLAISNSNIFVESRNGCVWKRPLSEVIANIWQADLTVKDNGNISQSLSFGQSPIASDSIDAQLGEAPLPPTAFGFDARFHLPTGDESWKDYRSSNLDTVEWLIKFQPGNGGYPITFTWDTTNLPQGSFFLKDIITGTIVNVNMKTSNSYTLTNTGINTLKIVYADTKQVVPVELTSFTASLSENNVNISWKTATEKNNTGFEIQRSNDGNGYYKIGFVEGNGTTTEIHKYNFKDINPPSGKLYYRLKQIDFSGIIYYSNVVEVNQLVPSVFSLSQNYPNPFNPTTTIKYGLPSISNLRIKIYNSLGQEIETLVDETQSAGYHEITWNASGNASGVYLYTIDAVSADGKGNFHSAKKLVLLK